MIVANYAIWILGTMKMWGNWNWLILGNVSTYDEKCDAYKRVYRSRHMFN
jgi:hypothetical protein